MSTYFDKIMVKWGFHQRRDFVCLCLLLICVVALYSITIKGPFTYDDVEQIANNYYIHHLANLKGLFLSCLRNTRPLFNLFLACAWAISPESTWPFHVGLIALHLVNTVLVFVLMRKLFPEAYKNRSILIWVTTVLFSVHPLQVQGVSYIMGGLSAFQCFFYLVSLNLYDSHHPKNDLKIRIILGVSMLCKESCLLIPAVLVWWDLTIGRFSLRTLSYRRHALFILSALIVLIPFYAAISNPATKYSDSTGFHIFPYNEYLLTQGYYYLFYLRLLFDSSMQSLIHPYPDFGKSILIFGTAGLTLCVAFIYFAISQRTKRPIYSFWVGFFFLSLLLTNTFFQMMNPFAEYRLYQANIALFVGMAYLISELGGLIEGPVLKTVAIGAPVLYLVWSSVLMQLVWSNEAAIYVYSLSVYPESFELNQLLGGYYEGDFKWDLAEEQYLKAVPLVAKAHGRVNFHPYRLLFRIYVYSKQWGKALNMIQKIETELSQGQLPDDGYTVYLRILRKIKDRARFDEIKKKAAAFYPTVKFPEWDEKLSEPAAEKKGPST